MDTLDEILGTRLDVLDDGFVRVVDYMGNDASIVQAARVSYGVGTRRLNEDRGLIRYLMRHHHSTPFEMCEIKLHVRVPMDTWRQWVRHRTANINEYSTRYSVAIDGAQRTDAEQWRLQSKGNKQGSAGSLPTEQGQALSEAETALQDQAREVYQRRLDAGVAREQARKDLPLSTYTEAYWKIDLHNLLHFLRLRLDPHAQLEIRQYAEVIGYQVVKVWCPLAWEAFEDYRLNSLQLTDIDLRVLQALNDEGPAAATEMAIELNLLRQGKRGWKRSRERSELERKMRKLRIAIPWVSEAD